MRTIIKMSMLFLVIIVLAVTTAGCGESEKEVPTVYLSYIFVDHHAPLFVALDKGAAAS